MKLVLESKEEDNIIKTSCISIDNLISIFNEHDLDRMIVVCVDVNMVKE